MPQPPSAAGPQTALAPALGEAALASGGWQSVASVLEAATPGLSLRFCPRDQAHAPAQSGTHRLTAFGLGTWTLSLPGGDAAPLLSLPLLETMGFALRLADGRPLDRAETEAVLDPLPYAAILLDGACGLLLANAAGEDYLHSRRLFRPTFGGARLHLARSADERTFEEAAARILDGIARQTDWTLRGPAPDTRLALSLRAVGPARPTPGAARLLLTLRAIAVAPPRNAPA